jgi:hypothetical protein
MEKNDDFLNKCSGEETTCQGHRCCEDDDLCLESAKRFNYYTLHGCSGQNYVSDEENDYKEIKLISTCGKTDDDSHVALSLSSVDHTGHHCLLNDFLNKNVRITIEVIPKKPLACIKGE